MTKNNSFSVKKNLYYLNLILLTGGASLILGLLSFSGMYALYPVLSWASSAFLLSSAYEGEIYLQNIKSAWDKLFKPHAIKQHMAKDYLLNHFPANNPQEWPQFFKDYKKQLLLLKAYGHMALDEEHELKKQQLRQTCEDMEYWFAVQLFQPSTENTKYAKELQQWLAAHQQQEWQEKHRIKIKSLHAAKVFSLLSGFFMGLGSTYLLVEAFGILPFFMTISFALWPLMILPMSVISGVAYGLLTYNTVSDLINNDTVKKWYYKLQADLQKGWSVRNVLMTSMALFLISLAIALTICTAGTWWTIATQGRPLYQWMKQLPSAVMGVINPVITGASAIFFNIQNTSESLEIVYDTIYSKDNFWDTVVESINEKWEHLRDNENTLQLLNPARLLLNFTIKPLRILLFLGHLASIAVTANRMPGLSQITSSLIALISEGFEDFHYFIDSTSANGCNGLDNCHQDKIQVIKTFKDILQEHLQDNTSHNHSVDIPTRLLQFIAIPLYAATAAWDSWASRWNTTTQNEKRASNDKRPLTFKQAWDKARGIPYPRQPMLMEQNAPSPVWKKEHALYLIEEQTKQLQKANIGQDVAAEKIQQLTQLKQAIRKNKSEELAKLLHQEKSNPVYSKQRFFALGEPPTTECFIAELPKRIAVPSVSA